MMEHNTSITHRHTDLCDSVTTILTNDRMSSHPLVESSILCGV